MKLETALLRAMGAAALLLVAACGGGSADNGGSSGNGSGQTQADASRSTPPTGGTTSSASTGGSGTSCPTPSSSNRFTEFDAPLVYLAQPGPITVTLLATPAPVRDSSFTTFLVFKDQSQRTVLRHIDISSNDAVGKTVLTESIPAQPAGIPIIFGAHVNSGFSVFGVNITTGWVTGNDWTVGDGQPNLAAQVSFGANNTAILSFGRVSEFLPASWANAPLRIQLTNVTGSCSLAP